MRQPRREGHHQADPGPRRAHLGHVLRGLGPAQGADHAPRRDLRPPVVHPTAPPSATASTGSPTTPTIPTADRPAPATRPPRAGDITGPRPRAAGPTSPSSPAPTSGAHPWATSTSATTPAPSTSPPTPTGAAMPASSSPTSATSRRRPDHPAPHPLRPSPERGQRPAANGRVRTAGGSGRRGRGGRRSRRWRRRCRGPRRGRGPGA